MGRLELDLALIDSQDGDGGTEYNEKDNFPRRALLTEREKRLIAFARVLPSENNPGQYKFGRVRITISPPDSGVASLPVIHANVRKSISKVTSKEKVLEASLPSVEDIPKEFVPVEIFRIMREREYEVQGLDKRDSVVLACHDATAYVLKHLHIKQQVAYFAFSKRQVPSAELSTSCASTLSLEEAVKDRIAFPPPTQVEGDCKVQVQSFYNQRRNMYVQFGFKDANIRATSDTVLFVIKFLKPADRREILPLLGDPTENNRGRHGIRYGYGEMKEDLSTGKKTS